MGLGTCLAFLKSRNERGDSNSTHVIREGDVDDFLYDFIIGWTSVGERESVDPSVAKDGVLRRPISLGWRGKHR